MTFHEDNLRYGATDYIPVSENGLVTVGSGTNGVTSQIVYDKDRNPLRHVDANDQYTYEEGDAYVVFCYFKSSAETLAVVEGTEYVFEKYSDYRPLDILTERVETLEGNLESRDPNWMLWKTGWIFWRMVRKNRRLPLSLRPPSTRYAMI